jgi:UrcA family protein
MNAYAPTVRFLCSNRLVTVLLAAIAAAPLIASADPASAPPALTYVSQVSVEALDLSSAQGMREARRRIEAKAALLCRQLWDTNSASFRWSYAACVRKTAVEALQQLTPRTLAAQNRPVAQP